MQIKFRSEVVPATESIIELYTSSGINRPTLDHERISRMYANSNLVVTAWDKDKLIGIPGRLRISVIVVTCLTLRLERNTSTKELEKR